MSVFLSQQLKKNSFKEIWACLFQRDELAILRDRELSGRREELIKLEVERRADLRDELFEQLLALQRRAVVLKCALDQLAQFGRLDQRPLLLGRGRFLLSLFFRALLLGVAAAAAF